MTRGIVTCAVVGLLALIPASPAIAADETAYSLNVKRPHLVGASSGTLRIASDGIQYVTTAKDEARQWTYPDIKQLQIQSPTRIVVLTYEDQSWLKLGADRAFSFELRDGSVTPAMVAFLLSQTDRPIATAVLPPLGATPLARVPVKHARWGRGSDGALLVYDDALVYVTERETEARYWRLADLYLAVPLDPFRYQVLAYEGGAGELRPFSFELKTSWPLEYAHDLRNGPRRSSAVVPAQTTRRDQ